MKKKLFTTVLIILLPVVLFANGLNLNGVGTKAIGMGGAFIGLANDYSAVYWNPAGLTQLDGMSISIFVTDVIPTTTYKFDMMQIDATSVRNHYISGALAFFFDLNEKMKIGV